MASLGHIAVGLVAARTDGARRPIRLSALAFWPALSLLPDVDVIGFALGVPYEAPWGHRGATHSLLMAVALGLTAGALAPALKQPALRSGILVTLVLASHGLLDTMTDGGLGCALFWPFDLTRYFAPWRPIPVAPIGLAFLSPAGLGIALVELALFFPLLAFALPAGRLRARLLGVPALVLWSVATWLIASTDPVREAAVGFVLREDTAYSSGFSERAFRMIDRGDSEEDVGRILGAPHQQSWTYVPAGQRATDMAASSMTNRCFSVLFADGTLRSASDTDSCRRRGVQPGMSPQEVMRVLGPPSESCWSYTWSPGNRRHRVRMVCFLGGTVYTVVRQWN